MKPCSCNINSGQIDICIQPLVRVLNENGFKTIASCCGHNNRPGNIALANGRELTIANYEESRKIDKLFHNIHGEKL